MINIFMLFNESYNTNGSIYKRSNLDVYLENFSNGIIQIIKKYTLPYLIMLFMIFILPTILGISSGVHEYYAKILKISFRYVNKLIADSNDILLPMHELEDEKSRKKIIKMKLIPENNKKFELIDICPLVTSAIHAIVDDNVTKRFSGQELKHWNMLKRSQPNYHNETFKICFIWWLGFIYRYLILLPNRIIMFLFTVLFIVFIGLLYSILPKRWITPKFIKLINIIICRMATAALSIKIHVHGIENMPKNGICVANHTTPLDAIILSSLRFFTIVGQSQGGFFGFLQEFLKKFGHIFFERSETLDRSHVTYILKEHATNNDKPPIILFPEGTCINNTSVMLFRKGSFEITNIIHPIAIKYRSMYGDAFWNSSKDGFLIYLIHLMSSWMVYCDIFFLPPVYRDPNQTTIEYAAKVRGIIAMNANLVELDWDGNLKRTTLPDKFKEEVKAKYAKTIILPKDIIYNSNQSNLFVNNVTRDYKYQLNNEDYNNIHNIIFYDDTIVGIKTFINWKNPFLKHIK